ncbi:MAG TPA: carboxypeptidase regulatory-like domain-containing protein [Thermoanaerobaculia bacterium]|nr:carboxypeptidase regulatory-like domain-containing protein [Thermoanaerobaculia bacterium]
MRLSSRFPRFLVCLLLATSALAQTQSGNIIGKVLSNDGSALPGVTVTVTGVGAPLNFVSNAEGDFRFLGLHPGHYTVTAELAGFSTVKREVDVILGRNTEFDFALTPAVTEALTVIAASPVIDTRDTGTGQNVENIELVNVPTARDPWVVLQSIPGVLVDRVNVGGNESGQQSYFVGKGVERHQTEWNIDGVAVSDMATTGSSTFYYDFDSFDELQISTGTSDPSVRTPGIHLNMVTKRGSNDLRGSGRYFFSSDTLQATPEVPQEGIDGGYMEPDGLDASVDRINDYGVEAGGPIISDRLWLWAAYSNNGINNLPTGGDSGVTKTKLNNWNGKLNAQFTNANNAEAFFMWNDKQVDGRGLGTGRPIETSRDQRGPGWILKLEDTHMFNANLYLTAKYAQIESWYELDPKGGRDVDAVWAEGSGWHRSYSYFRQDVPQKNSRADGAWFVHAGGLSHELKFGFGYRDTPANSETVWPGNGNYGNFYDGYALAALTRPAVPNFGSRYLDAYLGDTIVLGNLTLTGGLRYDIQRAKNFGSTVPANPLVPDLLPATSYAGDERTLEWKGISPRIGATWALGAEKKTMIKGAYNRYMDQLGSSDAGASNPFYRVQMLYYYWNDLNEDATIQRNEIDFDSGLYSFSNIDPDNPTAGFAPGRLDYGMDPTTTDELILGAERELMPNFAIGVNYTYRYRKNFTWERYEKTRGAGDYYTSADYVPGGVTTGTLPNGDSYSVPYWRLKAGIDAPTYYVITNRPDYHQTYHGLELMATKRFSDRWMFRGNVTLQDWKQHVGPDGFVDPTPIVAGDSCTSCDGDIVASSGGVGGYINSRWSYSLNSVVELPWKLMFGSAVVGREGYVIPYYRRVNARDGLGNRNVMVTDEFGSQRLDDLINVDLRLARDFAVRSGVVLNLSVDLFNATNERTVLWRDNRMYNGEGTDITLNNWIEQLQSPRIFRLGARVSF